MSAHVAPASTGRLQLTVVVLVLLQLSTVGLLAAILLKPNPSPPAPTVLDTSAIQAQLEQIGAATGAGRSLGGVHPISLMDYLEAICYALQNPDHPQGGTAQAGGVANAAYMYKSCEFLN